jgi:hypothetical protein
MLGLLILVGCGGSQPPPPDVSSSGSSDLASFQAMCEQIGVDGQCSPDHATMRWCGPDPGGGPTKTLYHYTCGLGTACGEDTCDHGANCCPPPTEGDCPAPDQCVDTHLQFCGVDGLRYDRDCGAGFPSGGVCIPKIGDQPAFCAAGCSDQQIAAAKKVCHDLYPYPGTPGHKPSIGIKFCWVGASGNGGGSGATGAGGGGGASGVQAPCAFE